METKLTDLVEWVNVRLFAWLLDGARVAVGDLPGMEKLKCYHLEHEALSSKFWIKLTDADVLCYMKGFYIMELGCWFVMIPHDFQGILDNIDRKTSCSDLATSLVWHLFLENARTRMLYLAILWIFTLCLPLYQLDIFVSWGEFVQLKLRGKEGRVANHPFFFLFAMLLQLHASDGACRCTCAEEVQRPRHGRHRQLLAFRGLWWGHVQRESQRVLPGRFDIQVRGKSLDDNNHNNKSSVNFVRLYGMAWPMVTPVFECCAKAKQSVSWVEAMAVCEGLSRWLCDHLSVWI